MCWITHQALTFNTWIICDARNNNSVSIYIALLVGAFNKQTNITVFTKERKKEWRRNCSIRLFFFKHTDLVVNRRIRHNDFLPFKNLAWTDRKAKTRGINVISGILSKYNKNYYLAIGNFQHHSVVVCYFFQCSC